MATVARDAAAAAADGLGVVTTPKTFNDAGNQMDGSPASLSPTDMALLDLGPSHTGLVEAEFRLGSNSRGKLLSEIKRKRMKLERLAKTKFNLEFEIALEKNRLGKLEETIQELSTKSLQVDDMAQEMLALRKWEEARKQDGEGCGRPFRPPRRPAVRRRIRFEDWDDEDESD